MKKIIYIFFILSSINFSAETGEQLYYSDEYADIGYGIYLRIGMAKPSHVWRRYEEDVNFTLNNIRLLTIGTDRTRLGDSENDLKTTGVLSVRTPRNISVTMNNLSFKRFAGPKIGENLTFTQESNNRLTNFYLPILKSGWKKNRQTGSLTADLALNIPWKVQDGTYNISSTLSGGRIVSTDGRTRNSFPHPSYSSRNLWFEVRTYLDVVIDSSVSFGKVIFAQGMKEQRKRGVIKISGSPGTSLTVSILDPIIYLSKVGGGKETVPVTLNLIDERKLEKKSVTTILSVGEKGKKNIQFEVLVNPGLYTGIPEGRYNGTAKFKIVYN